MRFESVWAVYFSACGSTRRVLRRMAEAAGEALALPVRELDYTLPPAREQNYAFGEGDLIFWGSPTYAGRLPNVLLPFLRGHFDQAMERMETMAALALSVVLRECKQMGTALTTEQGVRFLESHILPHQNRGILKNRADEIAMQFQSVLAKNNCQGIRTQAEKKEVASAWLELAISCAKVPVKYEADEIKRRQKEEKTQREAEPVMA